MTALDQAFIKLYVDSGVPTACFSEREADSTVAVAEPPPVASGDAADGRRPADEYGSENLAPETSPTVANSFRPQLQVDRFAWPLSVTRLGQEASAALDELADNLLAGANHGRKVVGFIGQRRGDGSTTLLLSAARRLAERGAKTLMVDADLAHPRLGRRLGVDCESGWQEVLDGRLPLAEVMIESLDEDLFLLPFSEQSAAGNEETPDGRELAAMIAGIGQCYELVLVDLGCLEPDAVWETLAAGSWLDASVVVCDANASPEEERMAIGDRLREAGVRMVGIVENFV